MPIPVAPPTFTLTGPGVPGSLLHPGQVALGEITFGTTDDYGVEWILESLKGWSDVPSSTGSTEQRASDHGGWNGPAYYTPRTVEIEGTLIASNWDGASEALDRLMAAIPLDTPSTLYVAEGARTLQADVRQEDDPLAERSGGWAHFSLSLTAADPRRYSIDITTVSTGLPITTGGLTLGGVGLTLPLSVGATVSAGRLSVVNDGNMPTRPTLTVVGPSPAFSITHIGTGKTLRFAEAIPAGRSLVIDTDRRRAVLDGTASRVVSGTWFEYAPGLNEVAFSAATYDPSALLVSESRSAWR